MKILLIDDNENIRFVVKEMIKGMFKNLEVFEASEGGEGIALIFEKRGEINLVITDYSMFPGENGFEVAKFVKENYPETKVIMMTGEQLGESGEEMNEFEKTAMGLGIKKIIAKPPDFKKLKNIIREIMNVVSERRNI